MRLTYGPALTEDVPVIFAMVAELIDRYEDFSRMDREKVLMWSRNSISDHLSQYRRIFRDGILVGYFCLHPDGERTELDNLFVLPAFRGQGIGTTILKTCIAGVQTDLYLYVFRENTGAVRLYRRMGFQVIQEAGTTRYIMEHKKEGC